MVASARAGITFVAMPACSSVTDITSRKTSPSISTSRGSAVEDRPQPLERERRSRSRRATAGPSAPTAPRRRRVAFRLPRQPSWSVLSVGSRQMTSCASSTRPVLLEDAGQRVLGRAELLAREEEEREVVGELGLGGPAGELDHHCEPAFHVARAEADDGAVLDPARQVPLRRHGVGVAGEQDERLAASLARRSPTRRRRRPGPAARRTGCSRTAPPRCPIRTGCRRGRGCARPVPYSRPMIPRSPEPERGFVLAVLARVRTRTTSWPRSRSSPARRASSRSARSSSTARGRRSAPTSARASSRS